MRYLVLVLALAACGATNPNQANYDKAQGNGAAAHDGDHAKTEEHKAEAPKAEAPKAETDHADGTADAGHADGKTEADHTEGAMHGDADAGAATYQTYCVACHGTDGQGMNGLAANFVADQERFQKDDATLVKEVREGYTGKIGVMPPWGAVVDEQAAYNAIAYIRREWQK